MWTLMETLKVPSISTLNSNRWRHNLTLNLLLYKWAGSGMVHHQRHLIADIIQQPLNDRYQNRFRHLQQSMLNCSQSYMSNIWLLSGWVRYWCQHCQPHRLNRYVTCWGLKTCMTSMDGEWYTLTVSGNGYVGWYFWLSWWWYVERQYVERHTSNIICWTLTAEHHTSNVNYQTSSAERYLLIKIRWTSYVKHHLLNVNCWLRYVER